MLTLQQDVVRHMKVTARVAGVPTLHWSANYTFYTVVPHFMTTSPAQWACVQLHSVAATATS